MIDNSGNAVPVSLIADPFARQVVLAAQTGRFSMADGGMNTLDLFHSYHPTNPGKPEYGVALVILNCLSTPLTLVDQYLDPARDGAEHNGPQLGYPATIDAAGNATKPHVIPGVRNYPRPTVPGGTVPVGGLGLYRFQAAYYGWVCRALAFSTQPDGSAKNPLIGVAFNCAADWRGNGKTSSIIRVTADLSRQGQKDTQANLRFLFGNYVSIDFQQPNQYDVGDSLTVWATAAYQAPATEGRMLTITMWVRDAESTLGMDLPPAPPPDPFSMDPDGTRLDGPVLPIHKVEFGWGSAKVGTFVEWAPKKWYVQAEPHNVVGIQMNDQDQVYAELARTQSSVFLYDPSRDSTYRIDTLRKKIGLGDAGGAMQDVFDILSVA